MRGILKEKLLAALIGVNQITHVVHCFADLVKFMVGKIWVVLHFFPITKA